MRCCGGRGDKKNRDLAERFGAGVSDAWPQIRLFRKGAPAAEAKPVPFEAAGDFSEEDLLRFVKREAGVYVGLKGTLEAFDKLAEEFSGGGAAARKAALAKAEAAAAALAGDEAKAAAYYVKVMRKTLEKEAYPAEERKRLDKVKAAARSEKQDDFTRRQNILASFAAPSKAEL